MGQGTQGGGGGEKKVTRTAFKRPLLQPEVKRAEAVVMIGGNARLCDKEKQMLCQRQEEEADNIETERRPEKRMKPTVVMESDAPKPTEETRTMDAEPEANVGTELTMMESMEKEVAGEEALVPELDNKKLRDDLTNLAEEATLDQDEELPHSGLGYLPTIATEAAMPPPIDERWQMDGTESYEERNEKHKIWAQVYERMFQELRQEWGRRSA